MFDAPGFSVLIQAKDPEDALEQAEQLASGHDGKFKVLDVHPADGNTGPARSV
jgi:hypothetical protein